ncbi:hypothetical protein F2Q68_00017743 [Brassica cretica]|uniref:Uncharacterized protein n=1 Tax=Brassica cretica TaxID=69181 RepID=A0A8S9HGH7_BRACR|nr:hypothetical protein F2Q68_00017743 [Brassica cretica]
MKASSFGVSSVKRHVISVSRTAGRSQRPRVSHKSRGLSPMKVDLGVVMARRFGVGSSSEASVCGRGELRSRHGPDGFG